MSRTTAFIPGTAAVDELTYVEHASHDRSLHVLLQEVSSRPSESRRRFLRHTYRDIVSRFHSGGRLETAAAFLRQTVRVLDSLASQVETRVEDFRDLDVYVLAREGDVFYLLCARGGSVRVRTAGAFVPITDPSCTGVRECPIETPRAQHDLFAQSLPDSLALYKIDRTGTDDGPALEILAGGTGEDLVAAMDALAVPAAGVRQGGRVALERATHAVMHAVLERSASARAPTEDAYSPLRTGLRVRAPSLVASAAILATLAAVAVLVLWSGGGSPDGTSAQKAATSAGATHERATPLEANDEPVERRDTEVAAVDSPASPSPGERFALAWERTCRDAVTSTPAMSGNTVVFGSRDGYVYAFDRRTGEERWRFNAGAGVGASPLVAGDAVIAADYAGVVHRLRIDDGSIVWRRRLGTRIVSTPASSDTRVAVGTTGGTVYGLSLETGRVLWKFSARGRIRGSIAYTHGVFFVPSYDGRLYALAEGDGSRRWAYAASGTIAASPAADDKRVVVGTARGEVIAVGVLTGKRLWAFRARGAVNSAILLDGDRVFAGSSDGYLHCIDATSGRPVWRFETRGSVLARPFVADGRVVVASYDRVLYWLDAETGQEIDRYQTTGAIYSSPVVAEGRLYVGNNDGRFYCLTTPN